MNLSKKYDAIPRTSAEQSPGTFEKNREEEERSIESLNAVLCEKKGNLLSNYEFFCSSKSLLIMVLLRINYRI